MTSPDRPQVGVPPTPGTRGTFDSIGSGPQCTICMGPLGDGIVLDPCEHSICKPCFGNWASTCRCAVPGVPPECVHCSTLKVECPFCRVLTTHPADSKNDQGRRKIEREQRHALRRAREQRRREEARARRYAPQTFRVTKSSQGTIGLRFRGRDVTEVVDGSPAAAAGLKANMRILEVDRRPVDDDSDKVHDALRDAPNTFYMKVDVPIPSGDAQAAAAPAMAAAAAPAQPQRRHNDPTAAPPPAPTRPAATTAPLANLARREEEGIRIPAQVNLRPAGAEAAPLPVPRADRDRDRQAREREERARLERRERERRAERAAAAVQQQQQQQQAPAGAGRFPERHHHHAAREDNERREREIERERAAEREREKLRGNQRVLRYLAEQRGVAHHDPPAAPPRAAAAAADIRHRRPGLPVDAPVLPRGLAGGRMAGTAHPLGPEIARHAPFGGGGPGRRVGTSYPMRHIMMP